MNIKDNKLVLVAVGVIVLIVLGFVLFSKKDVSETPVSEEVVVIEKVDYDGSYVIDLDNSLVVWEGKKTFVVDYADQGVIYPSEGTIVFTDGMIESGSIVFDMNSITALSTGKNSGQDMLSKHLKSADFFDTEKYPESSFVIFEVASDPSRPGSYMLFGDMTIKGKTLPISVPVSMLQVEQGIALVGDIAVDRTLWDVQFGSGKFFQNLADNTIDDYFTISFSLVVKE
ncbi:MAG: YceI family protein [Candidatus Pacebacteria bacterium]|nr:YceI family protein [Candidatus Paceibacterota bacterium]